MAQEILTLLADHARARVAAAKAARPLEEVRAAALALPKGDFAFERALARPGLRFICECKRASPSKGLIAPEFPYLAIAREYAAAGADAISVLTEPKWFLGSDRYLREIAAAGADAVLVGETLMRAADKTAALHALRGDCP